MNKVMSEYSCIPLMADWPNDACVIELLLEESDHGGGPIGREDLCIVVDPEVIITVLEIGLLCYVVEDWPWFMERILDRNPRDSLEAISRIVPVTVICIVSYKDRVSVQVWFYGVYNRRIHNLCYV